AEYGELPQPTRLGYDFEGWYTQKEGGEKIGGSTHVAIGKDHTLYAHWLQQPYTYLAEMNRYEWTGDGDHAFSVLSDSGSQMLDVFGTEFWHGAIGLDWGSVVNLSLTPATVTYDIQREYSKFEGSWGAVNDAPWDEEGIAYSVEIYGDDRLLFTTSELREGTATKTFSVDVSGVEHLTLSIRSTRMEFARDGAELRAFQYAVFDPTLYR
ncbi:MAG: NPCBM/NEW2 domain-containing protein, partial [Bifidobacteriaceae bacterium]|nr:NPCBM/NEW2 domain-containing protein [Bifidobacteriaceae bacterium]